MEEFIFLVVYYVLIFILGMLLHELCHIKAHSILERGTIYVTEVGMYATLTKGDSWSYYSGGIVTGSVFLLTGICLFLLNEPLSATIFILVSIVQLMYGVFEGLKLRKWGNDIRYKIGRYSIYLSIPVVYILLRGIL